MSSAVVPKVAACLSALDLKWAADLSFSFFPCDQYTDLLSLSKHGPVHLAVVSIERLPEKRQQIAPFRAAGGLLVVVVDSDEQAVVAYGLGAVEVYRRPINAVVVDLSLRSLLSQVAEARQFLIRKPTQRVGDLTISLVHHTVERDGHVRRLSATEWKLLCVFLSRPGHTFSRGDLAAELDGTDKPGTDQVELRVSRLRSKIELDRKQPAVIETLRGVGYRLAPEAVVHEEVARLMDPTRRVRGEPAEPLSEQESQYWCSVYSELVATKMGLLKHLKSSMERLSTTARQELVETDVLLLESQLERYNQRLALWSQVGGAPVDGRATAPR